MEQPYYRVRSRRQPRRTLLVDDGLEKIQQTFTIEVTYLNFAPFTRPG